VDHEALDDNDLVAAISSSYDAFDTFYRRHVAAIIRYLTRHCRSPEDVADACADTFVAVLDSSRAFDPKRGSAKSWLYAIARNKARDLSRTYGRIDEAVRRLQGRRLLVDDDIERIGEMIDAERAASALSPVLDATRPSERELLERIVAEDVTPATAARSLGIAPGAGRIRLSRLRDTVRIHAERNDAAKSNELTERSENQP
jgi:RNA polymerase sigma-70 factor (ECF subfamily)